MWPPAAHATQRCLAPASARPTAKKKATALELRQHLTSPRRSAHRFFQNPHSHDPFPNASCQARHRLPTCSWPCSPFAQLWCGSSDPNVPNAWHRFWRPPKVAVTSSVFQEQTRVDTALLWYALPQILNGQTCDYRLSTAAGDISLSFPKSVASSGGPAVPIAAEHGAAKERPGELQRPGPARPPGLRFQEAQGSQTILPVCMYVPLCAAPKPVLLRLGFSTTMTTTVPTTTTKRNRRRTTRRLLIITTFISGATSKTAAASALICTPPPPPPVSASNNTKRQG